MQTLTPFQDIKSHCVFLHKYFLRFADDTPIKIRMCHFLGGQLQKLPTNRLVPS